MLETHNKRDKSHLINLISRRSSDAPNFALLIGAGASASCGVKTASQMITEWRQQIYEQSRSDEPLEEWLQEQDWYGDDEEYSILFEQVYDQPSQRRIYIEECVREAKPSWGYIYLSNIIARNYFNIIFTPNFDDLLNEACFIYGDLRPMVCAHDSAVAGIRVTSVRPKMIKLHGDFLYDSIKNTIRETETLDKNMKDKFMQFAREYGIVVIGYGGNDRSIMDILDAMVESDGYFPNGLYWCKRDGGKVSKRLDRLMQRENAYWVEIDGFDEFMAELHEGLGLTLPDSVRDPYKATTERLNGFISPMKEIKHPIIKKNIAELEEQIKGFEQDISEKAPEEFDRLVPYRFLGDGEYNSHRYEDALSYYGKALIQNPDSFDVMNNMFWSYIRTEQFKDAHEMSERMIKKAPDNPITYWNKGLSFFYFNKIKESIASYNEALKYTTEKSKERAIVLSNRSNSFLLAGNWKEALLDAETALQIMPKEYVILINKCTALKKLDQEGEAETILQDILPEIEDKYLRAGAFATLDDKEKMLEELEAAIEEDSGMRVRAKFDPEFTDYREDPDFRKLVYGE